MELLLVPAGEEHCCNGKPTQNRCVAQEHGKVLLGVIHAITLTTFPLAHALSAAWSVFHFFKSRALTLLGKGHAGNGSGQLGYKTAFHQLDAAKAE